MSWQRFVETRSQWPLTPAGARLLLGRGMCSLVAAVLGSPGFLFNEQYIVKPARSQLAAFQWHHDSAWCCGQDVEYHPYVSVSPVTSHPIRTY